MESQYYIRSLPTCLGHFEFKTLRSPTVVCLSIGGSSSSQELRKNLQLPQAMPEALLFFLAPIEREEITRKFSHRDYFTR